jgi:protein tyrosine phosphatase (PTP) superfamily phosphohydrolase (DUF442 family)
MRFRYLVVIAVLIGCSGNEPARPSKEATKPVQSPPPQVDSDTAPPKDHRAALLPAGPRAGDYPHLQNLLQVTGRIYSGGEPHDEQAFAELEKLGVKTIVSVDGSKPNVEKAKKYGLRYVHIPIGYDGVPEEAGAALARLVREAEGPFYVHCHHGKHRGPAAAAVACVASGAAGGKEALRVLERAGTSKEYAGLWRDVENFKPPAAEAKLPELVETAQIGSFAAAMAQVDRSYDNLKLCGDANWSTPPDHPDLAPAQEALLLQEGLHEAGRNLAGEYDEQFKTWLAEAETQAKAVAAALRRQSRVEAAKQFTALEQSCKQCHRKYRDQGSSNLSQHSSFVARRENSR